MPNRPPRTMAKLQVEPLMSYNHFWIRSAVLVILRDVNRGAAAGPGTGERMQSGAEKEGRRFLECVELASPLDPSYPSHPPSPRWISL